MNCSEAEQLFDAYLDGQLTGSLRLELDAHRLRCRRCQQTLAMMEACEHVLTADRRVPELAEDFTERVMTDVGQRRRIPGRLRSTRVALAAGFVVQAAAVLILAIIIQSQPGEPLPGPGAVDRPNEVLVAEGGNASTSDEGFGFSYFCGTPRKAMSGVLAAVSDDTMGSIWRGLGYLNIDTDLGPFDPPASEESTPAPSSDHYSL
jgi:hypothetical protein